MPKTEHSEEEIDAIVNALKEHEDDDPVLEVVQGGSAVKRPRTVTAVDTEALPIDDAQRRLMEKESASKADPLLKIVRSGNTTNPAAMDALIEELAEEIFSLKFERVKQEQEGKDISTVAGKRVVAIKAMLDTILKKRELAVNNQLDFKSEPMQLYMRLVLTKIQESFKQVGYKPEAIKVFFETFQTNMANIEVELQRAMDANNK